MYSDQELTIRPIVEAISSGTDYKDEQLGWKKWEAPYFPHHTKSFGNERMFRVGEKFGMQMKARIRMVRYYGHYYDSFRMGILREESEQL